MEARAGQILPPDAARSMADIIVLKTAVMAGLPGWLIGVLGPVRHDWAFMICPSLATALLAVDFTVPLDSPVVSAISASDSPP